MTTAPRVFITGGASGLGKALAQRYLRAGARVLIGDLDAARCEAALAELREDAPAEVAALVCDVRDEAALEAAADWLDAHWGGVDLVFNNAGVAVAGKIDEVSLDDWRWIVDINLLGVVRGCKVFTPRLRRQGGGHLVNVASMAGLLHPPMMTAYNATKAAVVAISESLELELAEHRIKVSVVCPAFFRTNLHTTARVADPEIGRITGRLVGRAHRDADDIAALVYEAVARGDFYILTHREGEVGWFVKRLLPHGAYRRFMGLATRKMMGR